MRTGCWAACAVAMIMVLGTAPPVSATESLTDRQWGLVQVNAEQAWSSGTGHGATIAIVDTGVDLGHPDLAPNLVPGATFTGCAPGWSPCGDGQWMGNWMDVHGTHVAGIAAAAATGAGVTGVAPNAAIMPVKVLHGGTGSLVDVAMGIRWAVDHGADVINLSLGTAPGVQVLTYTGLVTELTDAVAYASRNGVVVVAAAGNEVASVCSSPAFDEGALCVVSTDRNELRSWYSNFAVSPDLASLAAPGGTVTLTPDCDDDIVSAVPRGTGSPRCGQTDHDWFAGTSMAAPHVSGVAALMIANGADRDMVRDTLLATARTPGLGTGHWTPVYGHGIVDAAAALATVGEPEAGTSPARPTGPPPDKTPRQPQ